MAASANTHGPAARLAGILLHALAAAAASASGQGPRIRGPNARDRVAHTVSNGMTSGLRYAVPKIGPQARLRGLPQATSYAGGY